MSCADLQFLVQLAELQCSSAGYMTPEALQAIESASAQLLQLLTQLIYPEHSCLELCLLLLEQSADVLDLCS